MKLARTAFIISLGLVVGCPEEQRTVQYPQSQACSSSRIADLSDSENDSALTAIFPYVDVVLDTPQPLETSCRSAILVDGGQCRLEVEDCATTFSNAETQVELKVVNPSWGEASFTHLSASGTCAFEFSVDGESLSADAGPRLLAVPGQGGEVSVVLARTSFEPCEALVEIGVEDDEYVDGNIEGAFPTTTISFVDVAE